MTARRALRPQRGARARFEKLYSTGVDPWGYEYGIGAAIEGDQATRRKYDAALEMIDRWSGDRFETALEIGCGDGLFTAELASRCDSLLAVDLAEAALARAADRVGALGNVTLARWDMTSDPILGAFDLVVCMDPLTDVHRPEAHRTAVHRVTGSVLPGGSLLISAVVDNQVVERARWARWFGRGASSIIDAFAQDRRLDHIETDLTAAHALALFVMHESVRPPRPAGERW